MTRTASRHPLLAAALALATIGCLGLAPAARAEQTSPYQRGPAPTATSARGQGAFAVDKVVVPAAETPGFKGGDLYLPQDRSQGAFGGVVLLPGFNGTRSTLSWLAPQLASQGFVVLLADTPTILDDVARRATVFDATLRWLRTSPRVEGALDRDRLAIWGWSMSGGGALREAQDHPELKAQVDVFPWDTVKAFPGTRVPSLVLAAQLDLTAPNAWHSVPMYDSLPLGPDKAYVELTGAGHLRPLLPDPRLTELTTAWLKLYVDQDQRYLPVLCGLARDRGRYSRHSTARCQS
ncbi:alpha/beta hydrolase [Arsenicicoccus dermatophilus]|uniref:poly(ethylene terephthalate) hydrolase family protein n=1 Tax=Arsenicicoccus dermatophilus TaxID=1076331 RepID=UPI001F4CF758|nr:alpha/beta hydrolase [Arsenicicoccus dermatophilus]MCH8612975.1 alpha/beta hydrolase [Arsenicicoccus dermatophilus]